MSAPPPGEPGREPAPAVLRALATLNERDAEMARARENGQRLREAKIEREVAMLAALSRAGYEGARETTAERLGLRRGALDKMVEAQRRKDQAAADTAGRGRPLVIADPEPWPEPVDGVALFDEMARTIRSYVILAPHQADAVALWDVFTHAFDAFDFSPRLVIQSPEKRSGKTRLVEALERLARRALLASGINAAALLRVIEQHAPTMLLDEIDTMMKSNPEMAEALRGLINSGFDRAGARFIKNVPTPDGGWEPCVFSTWCPLLLAGIGTLPDTIADRAVIIKMKRKRPDEKVKRLRARDGADLRELGRKAARWAADHLAALTAADPEAPAELHDRAADAWSPLLAIADLAGGEWPESARRAAVELSGGADDGESSGSKRTTLLADLRELFAAEPSGVLFTKEILDALATRDDRPWPEWKAGKPITGRQLAALLKPLGIVTKQTVRRGADHAKGYHAADFADAFARYLTPHSMGDRVTTRTNPGDSASPMGDKAGAMSPIRTAQKPGKPPLVTLSPIGSPPTGANGAARGARWGVEL